MITENRKKMSDIQWVIKTLLNGDAVKSSDLAEKISEFSGNEIASPRISSILSRISNPEKCDLGFFIEKVRSGNAFVYRMAKEALAVPEDKVYDLAFRTGKNRYTLEQALREFPALCKYAAPKVPAKAAEYRSYPDAASSDKKIGICLRYSDRCSVSLSASAPVFITVCAALALILILCTFIAYLFFYPLFISFIISGIIVLVISVWKISLRG